MINDSKMSKILTSRRSFVTMTVATMSLLLAVTQPTKALGMLASPAKTTTTSAAATTRRGWVQDVITQGVLGISAASITTSPLPSLAFDGTGSSAYAGRTPATKAELKKAYRSRVVADVKDFMVLGKAISAGETEGPAWVNFFITFQRREPDAVGRTYAALVDLRGLPTKKANEYEGGDGLLLANTYTKAGKPPDNTPAVKSFLKLSKTFDAIEAAGKNGNASKAKEEWTKTSALLSQYLTDVELPGDLSDPIYN